MRNIVIMPGGFHPFHAGHAALYKSAVEAFNNADVYVAATNDTKTRPFPFAIKEKLAKLAGVADKHFVQVKSPFQPKEITSHYNPDEDVLIYVRSEKDRNESPKPGGMKKDGTPAYLQPYTGKNLQPFGKHAYIAYLPTVEFGPGIKSATEIRNAWPKLDDRRKTAMVMSLYPVTQKNPKLAANVVKMLDMGMGEQQGVAEGFPQPGESSGKSKQFNPNAKVQTKEMTLDQILATVKGIPYVNNVVDDWDAKDYSWGVTKKVIEYAQYLQKNPQSVANLPPLVVIDGQLNDGAHRLSAINLLQKRMDPKNPLWKQVKLKVNFGTSADVAPEQGVVENIKVEPVTQSLRIQSTKTQPKQNVYVAPEKKTPAIVNHIKPREVKEGDVVPFKQPSKTLTWQQVPKDILLLANDWFWASEDNSGLDAVIDPKGYGNGTANDVQYNAAKLQQKGWTIDYNDEYDPRNGPFNLRLTNKRGQTVLLPIEDAQDFSGWAEGTSSLNEGPYVQRIVHPRKVSIYLRMGKDSKIIATDIPYEILDKYIQKVIQKYPQFTQTDFSFKSSDKITEEGNEDYLNEE